MAKHSLWAPVALAGAYLAVFLANFDKILRLIYVNSDASFARVLVRNLQTDHRRGVIKVGEAAHYSTLWFLTATRSFPFREFMWDVSPFLLSLAGAGAIAWACRKSAGRWAALLVLCLLVALTPPVLATTLPQGMRSHTWASGAFLVALLVFLGGNSKRGGIGAKLLLVAAGSILAAISLASDPLFIGSGLFPFWGAGLLLWLRRRTPGNRNIFLFVSTVAVAGLIGSGIIARLMYSMGYRKTYLSDGYSFAAPDEILSNIGSLLRNLLKVANGDFLGQELSLQTAGSFGVAFAVLVALASPFVLAKRALSGDSNTASHSDALCLYVFFWAIGAAAVAGGFSLSTVATGANATRIPPGTGTESTRYVVPIFFSLAACAPIWAGRATRGRFAASGTVAAFCALSIGAMAHFASTEPASFRSTAVLNSFLEQSGLDRGYAGYWDSHALTLASGMNTQVLPVFHCHLPSSDLCPFVVNVRTVWYRPETDTRSFLITNPSIPGPLASPPSPMLGSPALVQHFGRTSVYIYDHDIASRFSPGCSEEYFCPAPGSK